MDEKPGYLIQFTKLTSQLGEQITINTNLPKGATQEEIGNELIKLGHAMDNRMRALNMEVLARTGKNLADMGLSVPGLTNFEKEEK